MKSKQNTFYMKGYKMTTNETQKIKQLLELINKNKLTVREQRSLFMEGF